MIVLRTYLADGGGSYGSIFGTLIFVAATLTVVAAVAIVQAWRSARGWLVAAAVAASVFAVPVILFLGAAIDLRG